MKAIAVVVLALAVAGVRAQCQGACQDVSNDCPNSYEQGLCPGPDNIQCCPEPTPDCNGQCQDNSLPCNGQYQAGVCPGPDNVQCCTSGGPGPQPGSGCQGFADSQWNCVDPSCSGTVPAGTGQPDYECAEFVSRTLANAGLIPNIGPLDPQSSYASYTYSDGNTYDLLWTSSKSAEGGPLGLEDLLIAMGWPTGGGVNECTVLLVVGSGGYETHVAVGVASNTIDAHNVARFHVDPGFYEINNLYSPPGWAFNATRAVRPMQQRPAQKRHAIKLKP